MSATTLSTLLLAAGAVALPQVQGERTSRPDAPYSLPPVTGQGRDGAAVTPIVADGAPAAVERAEALGDEVPRPVAPVVRATAAGDVVESGPEGDPFFLGFAAGAMYPAPGETVDPGLLDQALESYPDGRPGAETYAFVMFSKRMSPERLAQLEDLGCRLLGFHPHYTQKVALPALAIDAVAALDFVRWIGVPEPWQKVHPVLSDRVQAAQPNQPLGVWINVYESDVGGGSARVPGPTPVLGGPSGGTQGQAGLLSDVWVTNGWQQQALEAAGVEVLSFSARANAFRARMMPQGLDLVTALDFVQFVESNTPARSFHDESMGMVNADDVRNFYDGGSNQRALAGVVDSGMYEHPDLAGLETVGWDMFGGDPFDDPCGHGSHVTGTMASSGGFTGAYRGVAPGIGWGTTGRLYVIAELGDDCKGTGDVAAVLSLTQASYTDPSGNLTPRPHVFNNSWGWDGNPSTPWVGTETEARLYDDSAYYDAQLQVFAAGNDGPSPSTVGLPSVAKNVLTVGNVLDHDDPSMPGLSGELWTSSSQGPCGDGRWKPNLVAPGRWIRSVENWGSWYTEKSGTSMAAPHVTGIVADLIDADPQFMYLPERISAHLMATAVRQDGQGLTFSSAPHLDEYGAGRVDGTSAVWSHSGATWSTWAFSLGSGSSTSGDFTIPSGATRLVAVMHYVERGASAGASKALVNDWDLFLDQPPLTAGNNTGEYYAQQSTLDNTEIRTLNDPIAGTWRWKIWPTSTLHTTYFGLTVWVETDDTSPTIDPTLTATPPFTQRYEPVRFDYDLDTPGGTLSNVHVLASTSGTYELNEAHTYLLDGPETNLLLNQEQGWGVNLGNVHPFFSRSAAWEVEWEDEGLQSFSAVTRSDNASNSGDLETLFVIVDGTKPGQVPYLWSNSHPGGEWSNDDTVDVEWLPATDPVSNGVSTGVDGYSWGTDDDPNVTVSGTKMIEETVTTATTPPLGEGAYWFGIRTFDNAGNVSSPKVLGPFLIDLQAPLAAGNPTSTTHQVGVSSCSSSFTATWDAALDIGGAGIDGYAVLLDNDPLGLAGNTVTETGTSITTTLATPNVDWYVHVRSIDTAGNPGPQVTAGPYLFDDTPYSTYCTAKKNSQGCKPQIGAAGTPSLSGGNFSVTATNVLNNKNGLLFWGTAVTASPFQGGTKCVANPVKRTPVQSSYGNPPPDDCSGAYAFNFDTAYMNLHGIGVGDTIHAQWWSRDPSASFTVGLTNALSFTVCP